MQFYDDMPGGGPDDAAIARQVAQLARDAATDDLEQRRKAVEGIYEICYAGRGRAPTAVPVLLNYIHDADDKVGESAAWGLAYCAPASVEGLIDCLAAADAKVRTRACAALGTIGDDAASACDTLRRLLNDMDETVRRSAAKTLGLVHDTSQRSIDALFTLAASPVAEDRSAALHALGNIGQALADAAPLQAREVLIFAALEDGDADVRWSAAYALESLALEPARHADLAMRCLSGETSERVRGMWFGHLKELAPRTSLAMLLPVMCEAVRAGGHDCSPACEVLALMGPAAGQAVPDLLDALGGEYSLAAARALWAIDRHAEVLVPVLADMIAENGEEVCDLICEMGAAAAPLLPQVIAALESEDNWDLQWAAADALGVIAAQSPQAVATLVKSLRHDSPVVRGASAHALVTVGAPAVSALIEVLAQDGDSRHAWAADILGRIGHHAAAAVPLLRSRMREANDDVAAWSAIALAKLGGDPQAIPALVDLLREGSQDKRLQAVLALQATGMAEPQVRGALEAACADEDLEVSEAAEEALRAISASRH